MRKVSVAWVRPPASLGPVDSEFAVPLKVRERLRRKRLRALAEDGFGPVRKEPRLLESRPWRDRPVFVPPAVPAGVVGVEAELWSALLSESCVCPLCAGYLDSQVHDEAARVYAVLSRLPVCAADLVIRDAVSAVFKHRARSGGAHDEVWSRRTIRDLEKVLPFLRRNNGKSGRRDVWESDAEFVGRLLAWCAAVGDVVRAVSAARVQWELEAKVSEERHERKADIRVCDESSARGEAVFLPGERSSLGVG